MPSATSILWWFLSVFGAGILVNLISARLNSPVDKMLGNVSEKWKAGAAKRKAQRDAEIDLLASDSASLLMMGLAENRSWIRCVGLFLGSALTTQELNLASFWTASPFFMGMIAVLLAIVEAIRAVSMRRQIDTAMYFRKELNLVKMEIKLAQALAKSN